MNHGVNKVFAFEWLVIEIKWRPNLCIDQLNVCISEESLSELTSCCEDEMWQLGVSGCIWEQHPLEFFLFCKGATSLFCLRQSVFLTSYWSPRVPIDMRKRLMSLCWKAGGCCLLLRRCLNRMQGMIHLTKYAFMKVLYVLEVQNVLEIKLQYYLYTAIWKMHLKCVTLSGWQNSFKRTVRRN